MNESAWYVRYGAKILGICTALLCFCLGIFTLVTFSVACIIAGLLLIVISILVITLEAPFCCAMVPQLQRVSDFTEQRSPLQRIIFYAISALLPLVICFGVGTGLCALALAGSCALNVWRFIQARRNKTTVLDDAPAGAMGDPSSSAPTATSYGYSSVPNPQEKLLEKAAVGAARGMIGGTQSGGYP